MVKATYKNVSYNKTINDFQFNKYQDLLTQEYYIYLDLCH